MRRHWTAEQRKRQSELIHQWKPWEKSTGAKTVEGKKRVSQNGLKHGGRSAEITALKSSIAQMAKLEREARKIISEPEYKIETKP